MSGSSSRRRPEGRAGRLAGGLGALARRPPEVRRAVLALLPAALAVEAGMRLVPLPRLASFLGVRVGTDPARPPRPDALPLTDRERRSVEAARLVLRRWPVSARCLRRALLVGHALRHRDPVLRIGAARHDGMVHAHAWIEVDGLLPEDTEHGVTYLPLRRARPR